MLREQQLGVQKYKDLNTVLEFRILPIYDVTSTYLVHPALISGIASVAKRFPLFSYLYYSVLEPNKQPVANIKDTLIQRCFSLVVSHPSTGQAEYYLTFVLTVNMSYTAMRTFS